MPAITPAQIRGARGLLDWSKIELAKAANLSVSIVLSAEGRDPGRVSPKDMLAMRDALEIAGIEFMAADDGVCLPFKSRQSSVFSRFM